MWGWYSVLVVLEDELFSTIVLSSGRRPHITQTIDYYVYLHFTSIYRRHYFVPVLLDTRKKSFHHKNILIV